MIPKILTTPPQKDYALIDSGEGMKLERYGSVKIARPDPQALWPKKLGDKEWRSVDAHFNAGGSDLKTGRGSKKDDDEKGKWIISRPALNDVWPIYFGDLTLNIRLTPFKHTGLFPEQLNNWLWCKDVIKKYLAESGENGAHSNGPHTNSAHANSANASHKKPRILNLFGYTGGASISASLAGAEVTHVDASRSSVSWAAENAKLSGVGEKDIRWILEDALSFVKREVRRGAKYDGIMMDPPAFGRGTKGEIWKIENSFLELFDNCLKLLSDKPLFMVLNGYAAGYSAIAYENNLQQLVDRFGGTLESGELAIQEEGPNDRLLPCGIVSRWKKY